MKFLVDENLGPRAAQLLDAFDLSNEVVAHKEWFVRGAKDTEWLGELASWTPRPVVITCDGRILTTPTELAALKQSKLHFVILRSARAKTPWNEKAWKLIRVWPGIVQSVKSARVPTVFSVGIREKIDRRPLASYGGR